MILTNDIIYKYFDEFKKEQKCEKLPEQAVQNNSTDCVALKNIHNNQ